MKKSIKDIQMKKSLGRILLLIITLFTYTHAQSLANYKLSANKTTAYEKEAVVISFEANQLNHADNMMFSLEPKKSSDYKIILLHKEIDDKKHHSSHALFTYLLFALKAKNISVDFNFTIRTASDKAVAQSYVDDHDGSVGVQTNNTKIQVKPLYIKVKKLAKNVDLVGDFSFKESIQKTTINQYESVNIVYVLRGKGYEDNSLQPIKKIDKVTLFSEINNIYLKATKKGYEIKREYIYALSAKKDFIIPAVKLQAFSPKSDKYYTLSTPQHAIKVTKIDTTKLLDNQEYPQNKTLVDFSKVKEFLIYLLIFLSGFISAKFQSSFSFTKKADSKALTEIKQAQTPRELLFSLINRHLDNQCPKEVKMLEEMVYNNAAHNFQTIKDKIIKGGVK